MKKVLSIILLLALFMGVVSVQAVDTRSGGYDYSLDSDNNATITGYNIFSDDVNIPSTLDGHPVIAIKYTVFSLNRFLKSIIIPSSVTKINEGTFLGCSSLTSVAIPSSVTSIGNEAFSECTNLQSVVIPEGVISIGESTFFACTSLTSITIPSSVTSIGENAFKNCSSLASVTILNSDASIGDKAFEYTPWYSDDNEFEIDENGILTKYNGLGGDVIIPDGVTSIGGAAFNGCTTLTSVKIPDGVTSIADGTINRDNNVTENGAFYKCVNLESVIIPDSITYIGIAAFGFCNSLTSINIPSSITRINKRTFYSCGLTSIILPNGITSIDEEAFNHCNSLVSVTIPNNVTMIGYNAFANCGGLTEVAIPSSVILLGNSIDDEESPFVYCHNLTAINVDSENPNYISDAGILFDKDKTMLMQYPAKKSDLSYAMPDSVTILKSGAFINCNNLKRLTISNNVTTIWATDLIGYQIRDCKGLESLVIPPGVTSIEEFAFKGCVTVVEIYGVPGSEAESFAKLSGVAFINIKDLPPDTTLMETITLVAVPSATKMVVNGVNVAVDSYLIGDNNYIKLRDLAAMVNNTGKNFNVTWDGANNAINLLSNTPYIAIGGEMAKGDGSFKIPTITTSKIYIDGKEIALTAYNISGNNYFKLRDVMQAFNIAVGYDNATQTATLDTSKGY